MIKTAVDDQDNLTHGFFVEAGAADCEWSITLPLEATYRWQGILYHHCLQEKNNLMIFRKD